MIGNSKPAIPEPRFATSRASKAKSRPTSGSAAPAASIGCGRRAMQNDQAPNAHAIPSWKASAGRTSLQSRCLSVLPHLTDQDLKELGVSLGHRRKMLAAVAELG